MNQNVDSMLLIFLIYNKNECKKLLIYLINFFFTIILVIFKKNSYLFFLRASNLENFRYTKIPATANLLSIISMKTYLDEIVKVEHFKLIRITVKLISILEIVYISLMFSLFYFYKWVF